MMLSQGAFAGRYEGRSNIKLLDTAGSQQEGQYRSEDERASSGRRLQRKKKLRMLLNLGGWVVPRGDGVMVSLFLCGLGYPWFRPSLVAESTDSIERGERRSKPGSNSLERSLSSRRASSPPVRRHECGASPLVAPGSDDVTPPAEACWFNTALC
ncbi:hypothetical protein EYF80_019281 [Liparis tanakae]|uniref:Uncharacterized protein n=1 Tax=Liparis tanakae TaxID=230148 RepID=A0A4Z2HXF1_9TELE|nr:hypothetical protein EYF80_019281 [Liparis tanakae]